MAELGGVGLTAAEKLIRPASGKIPAIYFWLAQISDMWIIYAIFKGEVITAGFGKLFAKWSLSTFISNG